MRHHGHSAIPVLSDDNKYIGTISEGDFLWYLVDDRKNRLYKTSLKSIEEIKIRDIFKKGKPECPYNSYYGRDADEGNGSEFYPCGR